MIVTSVQGLLTYLQDSSEERMYRGQTQDWPLLPSIGRYPDVVKGFDDWRGFHDHIVDRFLRLGLPYLGNFLTSGTNAWVLAQHHGTPTRLLDTTTNPLKALFFAVNNPADDPLDGVVWVFSYSGWQEDLAALTQRSWGAELVPFLPAQLNPRLTAQEGSFISYPLPKHTEPLRPIEQMGQRSISCARLVVPAGHKRTIRRELSVLGIQFRLLFPDLDGVARSIRLQELDL